MSLKNNNNTGIHQMFITHSVEYTILHSDLSVFTMAYVACTVHDMLFTWLVKLQSEVFVNLTL